MFAPDEITQTTGALEGLSGVLERQSASRGKRPRITEDKNTDILPSLTLESPNAKAAWRQVAHLRKENMYLRAALEAQRAEVQRVQSEYTQLQSALDHGTVEVHQDGQPELAYTQTELQGLVDERDQLSERLQASEERYQTLEKSFQDTVQEEAHKLMQEAAETAISSPDYASPLIQDVVKTVEVHVRQEEDKHLLETLYLKREVQRIANLLEQERQQLYQEQQQLLTFQLSVREQATVRQQLHEQRLHTHQKVKSLVTSFSLLALFIVLEFVCLALFRAPSAGSVTLSILLPIVVCVLLRMIVITPPFRLIKIMYKGAPHKRRVQAQV